jgi:MFS family permease
MRYRLTETPEFLRMRANQEPVRRLPIAAALAGQKLSILIGLGLVVGAAAAVYVLFLVLPSYAVRTLHLAPFIGFVAPAIGGTALAAFSPIAGLLADQVGFRRVIVSAAALFILSLYPAFSWLYAAPGLGRLAAVQCLCGLLLAGYLGPLSAVLAQLYPVESRATSLAIANNVGVGLFGGFAPFIVTWLLAVTGNPLVPAFYVAFAMAISLVCVACLPSRRRPVIPDAV